MRVSVMVFTPVFVGAAVVLTCRARGRRRGAAESNKLGACTWFRIAVEIAAAGGKTYRRAAAYLHPAGVQKQEKSLAARRRRLILRRVIKRA
jgi:hypothetical protein